jgi:hypothetical protein
LETTVNTINTVQGAEADAATADDLSDVTTTTTEAKLRRLLLRLAPSNFTATIQGAAQTDLAAMLGTMATYFKAAGAAYSATIGGGAEVDVESSLTALAAYFNAASAALSVVSQPGVAARTNLNDITQDLADILAGAGITNFPASAIPGNGVSIAQVVSKIYDLVTAVAIEADVNTSLDTIVPATPTAGALTDILSKAAGGNTFDKATDSLEALADTIAAQATGIGTIFHVVKSVLQSAIVTGGSVDLTTVSSGGLLEVIGAYVQNGGTAFNSATHTAVLNLISDNARGSGSFYTMAEALGLANAAVGGEDATTWGGVVLETGKKIGVIATGEDFTSGGTIDIYLIFRRLAAGATIAAA